MPTEQTRAHLALLGVALIYGANYSIAKIVLDDGYILPKGFILMRVFSGMILFWLFHQLFVREKVLRKDWWRLALCGVFGVAVNQLFFFMGLKLTTPINASLIMTTTPILVLIASSLLIGERFTLQKLAGILLGAVGAIILILNGQSLDLGSEGWLGDLMILVNASSYGIYLVLVKDLMKRYHPITVVKWVFTFGFIYVLPFGFGELQQVDWTSFTIPIWLAVVYVLLMTTFMAYLLNAFALSKVNPSVVSIYIYLQPLVAAIVALFLQQDIISGQKIMAASLILAAFTS